MEWKAVLKQVLPGKEGVSMVRTTSENGTGSRRDKRGGRRRRREGESDTKVEKGEG
jgi:hypothetical protein